MKLSDPYHYAYLVLDLEQAMPECEALLGVEFRAPMVRELVEGAGPDLREPDRAFEVTFTYSISDRRPYIELMQAGEGPIFGPEQEGFHHVGIFVPEIAALQRAQDEAGVECEGRFFSPDGLERVWFGGIDGVRAEFINEAIRPATEQWLTAGESRAG